MNSSQSDVIEILNEIKELERNGFDLLNTVPDNGATCSVQVKFYINAIIDRAKEQIDYCIEVNVNKENPSEMNVSIEEKNGIQSFEIRPIISIYNIKIIKFGVFNRWIKRIVR